MSSLQFPESKAKWIVLGFSTLAAFYVFSKMYNKTAVAVLRALTEDDEKILLKYKHQLVAGNGAGNVIRNMIRFKDRHLIPHLFPGQDPNQPMPKRKKRKPRIKSNLPRIESNLPTNWDDVDVYEKPKVISVEFPVDVFLRMRPLIKHEIEQKHEEIDYNIKKTKKTQLKKFILTTNQKGRSREYTFKGLKNIILPNQDNAHLFKQAIVPCIDALFNDGTPCASFAYGHSGSGKTHTMFGYKNEAGLHRLFAEECLKRLADTNMFLEVRLVELYQTKIRDLLCSDEQNEIALKQTKQRGFLFRQLRPKLCDDGKYRQFPITTARVQNAAALEKVLSQGIASRNVGNSTIHDQSSRSHAFLEYEIVNDALCEKRKEELELEADLTWFMLLMEQYQMQRKGKKGPVDMDKAPAAFKEALKKGNTASFAYDVGRIEGTLQMFHAVDYPKILKEHKVLGKSMVFVDLAGNEYGRDAMQKDEQRDVQEEKERKQINADLMALKECIRALHGKNRVHIPYRQSNVTKYLKRYLGEENSKAVMISTIGTSKEMASQTLNTLKYMNLVANA